MQTTSKPSVVKPKYRCWLIVPASKPTRSIGCANSARQLAMSLTSQGSSRSRSTFPLPSTMQSAQDRSDTSIPAKYSIFFLPCSRSSCDLIGSSTSKQRVAQLRMLRAGSSSLHEGRVVPVGVSTRVLSLCQAIGRFGAELSRWRRPESVGGALNVGMSAQKRLCSMSLEGDGLNNGRRSEDLLLTASRCFQVTEVPLTS